jgi:hypothetical protein
MRSTQAPQAPRGSTSAVGEFSGIALQRFLGLLFKEVAEILRFRRGGVNRKGATITGRILTLPYFRFDLDLIRAYYNEISHYPLYRKKNYFTQQL